MAAPEHNQHGGRADPVGRLDHVALLVPTIEAVRARLDLPDASFGPVETFPGEGTRECYVGAAGSPARLLLMQALDPDGPYGRAWRRRGASLHHIAFNVHDLSGFVSGLAGSGWYLLPQSLRSIAQARTAWLARPGVGTLCEVHEKDVTGGGVATVAVVEVPVGGRPELLQRLRPNGAALGGLVASADGAAWLTIGGRRRALAELVG